MGIKVLRGRNFGATDRPGSPLVAIVSQSVARSLPQGEKIIGSRIRLGRLKIADGFTVIGVVPDVREGRPDSPPAATIYALSDQLPEAEQGVRSARMIVLVLRTSGDPSNIAKAVRTEVDSIDKDQPVGDVLTMRQLVDNKLADRRSTTALIGVFAVIAVVLSTIGVFGLVSYSVSCRTTEIGIRMALGARSSKILAMITVDTLAFGFVGVVAGILVSLGASRLLIGMLYGVAPTDPYILGVAAALMATIIILSGIFAARRVIALDPMVSIRHE